MHMEKLKKELDDIKEYVAKDNDFFLVIEGKERIGKSGLTCAVIEHYDPEFDINNVVYTREGFVRQVLEAKKGGVVWVDEGGLVFCPREGGKRESILVSKLLQVMGYKNLLVVICVPRARNLFREIREERMNALIKVYRRGMYSVFTEPMAKKYLKQKIKGIKKKEKKAQYLYIERYGKPKSVMWEQYEEIKKKRITEYAEFMKVIEKDLKESIAGVKGDKEDDRAELDKIGIHAKPAGMKNETYRAKCDKFGIPVVISDTGYAYISKKDAKRMESLLFPAIS